MKITIRDKTLIKNNNWWLVSRNKGGFYPFYGSTSLIKAVIRLLKV